jgi:hypothetical protein
MIIQCGRGVQRTDIRPERPLLGAVLPFGAQTWKSAKSGFLPFPVRLCNDRFFRAGSNIKRAALRWSTIWSDEPLGRTDEPSVNFPRAAHPSTG